MNEEQQSPQCNFHSESMRLMSADIKELNKKVADIPVLITKLDQFIDATKKMQGDLEVISDMNSEIKLLKQEVSVLQREKETCLNKFDEFKKEEFKPVKESVTMIRGMALLLPPIWTALMFFIKHALK